MEQKNLLSASDILREKSEKGKLIVFVGSGVSRNVQGMPSWEDLIKAMANAIGYSKCGSCNKRKKDCEERCLLKDSFSSDEYLKIPQYLYNRNKNLYEKIFREQFKEVSVSAPLSEAIFKLNPAHIITTNYDHLLESTKCEGGQNYEVIIEDKDLLKTQKSKYIIKMHGDLDDLNSIVLKEEDYLNFSQNKVLIEHFVKALLTDHTVLFLGYSLSDYNIKQIVGWLNFMRKQNGAFEGQTVGFIALDDENISEDQIRYFKQISIEVLNLRGMPTIENIPESLWSAVGRRLYSFLSVVNNPRLKRVFDHEDFVHNIYSKIRDYDFISYKSLLNLMRVISSDRLDNILFLFQKADFDLLKKICEGDSQEAKAIHQQLVDNGIERLSYKDQFDILGSAQNYQLPHCEERTLYCDKLFYLYIFNDILALDNELQQSDNIIEINFYKQFYCFDLNKFKEDYNKIDLTDQSKSIILSYSYNNDFINALPHSIYFKTLRAYYESLSPVEQNLLPIVKELIYASNERKLAISENLKKLEEIYSSQYNTFDNSLNNFYKIKDSVYELYYFFFYNHLFYCRFKWVKDIAQLYAEAIMCVNGTYAKENVGFWGFENKLQKHKINMIDWDILTKFISTKELLSLLEKFHVENLELNFDKKKVIGLFKNLVKSLDYKIWADTPFWSTVVNSYVLFTYIDFNGEEKEDIEEIIIALLSNVKFMGFFFSIRYPDFRSCLNPLVMILSKVVNQNYFFVIHNIIFSQDFWEYYCNISGRLLRNLFKTLMPNPTLHIQKALLNWALVQDEPFKRANVAWLISESIENQEYIDKLQEEINKDWCTLSSPILLDAILSDLIIMDDEKIKYFIDNLLELDNKRDDKNRIVYPDPLEEKIEILCILILSNKIKDLEPFFQLKNKTEHLKFLLSPEKFDYSQVDFSDYMWENFARSDKYLPYFIDAKNEIIPKIKGRIAIDAATEFERQMLYGVLLSRDEILKNFSAQ